MIGFLRALKRALTGLGRFRIGRPLGGLLALLWGFDVWVRVATDAQWFGSVGRSALWRAQMGWKIAVFAAFGLVALGASVAVMRVVARPVGAGEEEPPLPRALLGWTRARTRATRWGWLVLLAGIAYIGSGLSAKWPDFALSGANGAGASAGLGNGAAGAAGADFWVWHAPVWADILGACWRFGLLLAAVAVGVGALRALPFLAARQSIAPRRWLRLLTVLGAALLLVRALGFASEAARAVWSVPNQSEIARFGVFAVSGVGVVGCLVCALWLRRPRPRLALLLALGVVFPALLSDVLPAGNFFPATREIGLTVTPISLATEKNGEAPLSVPIWDEAMLLRAVRGRLARRQGRLTVWEMAGLDVQNGAARAEVVGEAPVADAWAGHGWAGDGGELGWSSLDLPDVSPSRQGQPLGPLFYGLDTRPLLSDDARSGGVALKSWAWKLAWAWRLRDPLLLLEGARAKRLLVFRGARECGQKLAPFWLWDEAVPRRDARTGSAYFECVAYAATPDLPSAPAFPQDLFAGQNAAAPVAVLRMNCRDGAVEIAPFAPARDFQMGTAKFRPASNSFLARWRSAMPPIFDAPAQNASTRALELARAEGTPLVWMEENGWRPRAVPVALRAAFGRKLADFDGAVQNQSVTQTPLEGATPSLWRRGKKWFLARPAFTSAPVEAPVAPLPPLGSDPALVSGTPVFRGFQVGEIGKASLGWGHTLQSALDAALVVPLPFASNSAPREAPAPISATPRPAPALETRQAAREAIAEQNAAQAALKAGRYIEFQRHFERERQLVESLARP